MKNNSLTAQKIKKLSLALCAATSLTQHVHANPPAATLDNNGEIFVVDVPVTLPTTQELDLLGSGRFIFTQSNNSIANNSTVALKDGALEATNGGAFGSAQLTFVDGSTFYSGSAQDYTTNGNPSDNTDPLIIANNMQLVTTSADCGLTFNTKGLVVDTHTTDIPVDPTDAKYRPLTLSGALSKSDLAHDGTVTFTSTPTYPITLSGDSHTGATIDNVVVSEDSQLILNHANALPSTFTQLTLNNGSVLEDKLTTSFTAGVLVAGSSATATVTVDESQTLTLSGAITAANSSNTLNSSGAGTLVLEGTNRGGDTYPTLSINTDNNVKVSALTKLPPVVTLNGGLLAVTSNTTLSDTTFTLAADSTLSAQNSCTVTLGQALPSAAHTLTLYNGTFDLNSQDNSNSLTSLNVNYATLVMHATKDTPPAVTLHGALEVAANATPTQTTFTLSGDSTFQVDNGATFTLLNDIVGSSKITKTGMGTLVLAEANTNNNISLEINAGKVQFSAQNNLFGYNHSTPTAVTFGGGVTDQLQYTGSSNVTVTNPLTLNADATFDNGSEHAVTLSGAITGEHTLHLTNTGGGSVILDTDNHSSSTTLDLQSGTLGISDVNNLPGATLALNGGTLEVSGTTGFTNALTVSSDSNILIDDDKTLTYGSAFPSSSTHTVTILGQQGAVSSAQNYKLNAASSGIFKFADGTDNHSSTTNLTFGDSHGGPVFQVSAANHFPDATVTLDAATLHVTDDVTAAPTLAITHNPIISVDSGKTFTLNTDITGTGALYKQGSGTLVFGTASTASTQNLHIAAGTAQISAANQLPGNADHSALYFDGGTLYIQSASPTILQPMHVTANSALTIDDSNTVTFGSTATFSIDANTLTVSNATGTSGATLDLTNVGSNATAGTTLKIDSNITVHTSGDNQLPGGGALTLNGGTWNNTTDAMSYGQTVNINDDSTINADSNITLNGNLNGSAALTKTGVGSLIVTHSNAYSGALTVSAGALELQHASGVASASSLTLAVSTTLNLNTGSTPTFSTNIAATGAATLNVAQSATYSGLLSKSGGSFNVTAGSNILTLAGSQNTTNASLTLSSGTIAISSGTNLPKDGITLSEGTKLQSTAGVRLTAGSLVIQAIG